MKQSSTPLYVGLYVHKDSIAIAYAPQDREAEVITPLGAWTCIADAIMTHTRAIR